MKQFATLTLIGKDKSGVVASVTQYLFETGGNIEGLEEAVSRGEFSMTLQASWPEKGFDQDEFRKGIRKLAKSLGMELTLHFTSEHNRQRMAILVTRETHVFEALIAESKKKTFRAEPVVVIGNRKEFAELAKNAGLAFHHVDFVKRPESEAKVLKLLQEYEVDFLTLARFMKIFSPNFVWRWKNKIINIHPSLLPAFPGAQAYRQAYEKGVKIVGVTAHFATADLDQGPIICQDCFQVKPDETLPSIVKRGQALEAKCLVRAVNLFLKKSLDVHWGRVYGV